MPDFGGLCIRDFDQALSAELLANVRTPTRPKPSIVNS
jgi:hypothetical protein